MSTSALERLMDRADARAVELIDSVVSAILDSLEPYGHDAVAPQELRRAVDHNVRYILAHVREPTRQRELSTIEETGRRRAREGVPLPEVLSAYRITFAELWKLLRREARRLDDPDTTEALLVATGTIWKLAEEYSDAVTDAYRGISTALLVHAQHRRSAVVDAVLGGARVPGVSTSDLARLLDLPAGTDYVVVVAEPRGAVEEGLPGIESRLADLGVTSAWRLSPARQSGLLAVRRGQREQVVKLLRSLAFTRTGISPTFGDLTDTPRAFMLADTALAGAATGEARVVEFPDDALSGLVAHDPGESGRLAGAVLGPILDLPGEDCAVLLTTLTAWFDHSRSAERAGEALTCHPNTVRYRLRRVEELTARSPYDAWDSAELAVALQALSQREPGEHRPAWARKPRPEGGP